ncbi:hypothetical protein RSAG8_00873, partial [Rhizoctonia solani AG-8 WAC10335]
MPFSRHYSDGRDQPAYQRPLDKPPDDLVDENGNPSKQPRGSNNIAANDLEADDHAKHDSADGMQQSSTLPSEVDPDLPHLVQQFIALDSRALYSEKAWSLWSEIISNQLAIQVPAHFIIRFARACADNISDSKRHSTPGREVLDPWITRLGSVLDYLSTYHRPLGSSEQIELVLVRVKHALLSNSGSMVAARVELDDLWRLKSLDSPIFLAAIFQAIRLIVQAQPDLSNMIDMLIDYWDVVHPALPSSFSSLHGSCTTSLSGS